MEMETSKVLIQFLVIFKQIGDVLSFLYARKLRGYTATILQELETNRRIMLRSGGDCLWTQYFLVFSGEHVMRHCRKKSEWIS